MDSATQKKLLNGIRILVLDDDENVRTTVSSVMERHGSSRVVAAKDGCQGLHELLRHEFDLVILDLNMPGMDGMTFLREARKIWPWLGVVVLSGFISPAIKEELTLLKVHEIHDKPIAPSNLCRIVAAETARLRARLTAVAPVPFDQVQRQLRLLRQISDAALRDHELADSMMALSRGLGDLLPCDVAGILLLNQGNNVLVFHVRNAFSKNALEHLKTEVLHQVAMLGGRRKSVNEPDVTVFGLPLSPGDNGKEDGSTFTVPLIIEDRFEGLLVMASAAADAFSETDISLVYHAANHLSTVLAALQQMHQLAVRDSLTGLYNRRFLQETMNHYWSGSRRHKQELSVAILDIDRFKEINDRHGHFTGDLVLKEIGTLVLRTCRSSDVVARYGGDEVVVIMPQTPLDCAEIFTRRLLENVRTHVFRTVRGEPLAVSISVGVAGNLHADKLENWDGLISLADRALYAAKEHGRDGYCLSPNAGTAPAKRDRHDGSSKA